jgi:hypothetical protein
MRWSLSGKIKSVSNQIYSMLCEFDGCNRPVRAIYGTAE